jgi:hypothetical protein
MHHEGYVATIELNENAGLFHGEVINTREAAPLGGFAHEAGGGETRELIADEKVVKRLIVEMAGIVPSPQEFAERLGFPFAGQSELWIKPKDAVPARGFV